MVLRLESKILQKVAYYVSAVTFALYLARNGFFNDLSRNHLYLLRKVWIEYDGAGSSSDIGRSVEVMKATMQSISHIAQHTNRPSPQSDPRLTDTHQYSPARGTPETPSTAR